MSVAQKIRMIPIVIVVAVVGIGALIYLPQFSRQPENYRTVSALLTFTPHVRTLPVKATFTAAGETETVNALESPVARTYSVKVGGRVTVRATQPTGLQISCVIKQAENGNTSGVKNGGGVNGTVVCALTVT